jgi:hypothetical protein
MRYFNFRIWTKCLTSHRLIVTTNRARLKGDPTTLFIIYLEAIGKERYSISDGVNSSEVSEMRLVTASRREVTGEATSNEFKLSCSYSSCLFVCKVPCLPTAAVSFRRSQHRPTECHFWWKNCFASCFNTMQPVLPTVRQKTLNYLAAAQHYSLQAAAHQPR